ncbi:MaoC family dehydratase [Aquabacterium sp.]|uniref:MaoC family dehydratase n=1 Tax=Aquabacterium sp. TaxID=1872578 RepID=UPI0035B3A00C
MLMRTAETTMKTIEISSTPSALSLYSSALRSSSKRPGSAELPAVRLVRSGVMLDGAHIERYARVCGFRMSQGVPPTYPHMLAFPLQMKLMCSPAFPWSVMGLVHLGNTIEQHRALAPGQKLDVEVATGELIAHDKGQVFSLLSRATRNGELVWESASYYLRMGVRAPRGTPYQSALIDDTPLSRQADWQARADIGRRYGSVSGDINPIHLSAVSAKLFGFKRAIAHGMWTKARALATLLPQEPVEHVLAQVEFKTPLFLPGRATLWTGQTQQGVLFEVRNGRGDKPHLRGKLAL